MRISEENCFPPAKSLIMATSFSSLSPPSVCVEGRDVPKLASMSVCAWTQQQKTCSSLLILFLWADLEDVQLFSSLKSRVVAVPNSFFFCWHKIIVRTTEIRNGNFTEFGLGGEVLKISTSKLRLQLCETTVCRMLQLLKRQKCLPPPPPPPPGTWVGDRGASISNTQYCSF